MQQAELSKPTWTKNETGWPDRGDDAIEHNTTRLGRVQQQVALRPHGPVADRVPANTLAERKHSTRHCSYTNASELLPLRVTSINRLRSRAALSMVNANDHDEVPGQRYQNTREQKGKFLRTNVANFVVAAGEFLLLDVDSTRGALGLLDIKR